MASQSSPFADLSSALADAVAAISSHVVEVQSYRSLASGFFWREGLIITPDETLAEEGKIEVELANGTVLDAKLVGRDPATDIALLRADGASVEAVTFGPASIRPASLALLVAAAESAPLVACGVIAAVGPAWQSMRGGTIGYLVNGTNVLAGEIHQANGTSSDISFDFELTGSYVDSDGDGIPDYWELAYGLNPNNPNDANLDADGDGMTNLQEFRAGTDPTNSASALKLSVGLLNPLRLQFVAQSNISYSVQFNTSLIGTPWSTLSNVAAQPLVRTVLVTDPSLATNRVRFYRAVTP